MNKKNIGKCEEAFPGKKGTKPPCIGRKQLTWPSGVHKV